MHADLGTAHAAHLLEPHSRLVLLCLYDVRAGDVCDRETASPWKSKLHLATLLPRSDSDLRLPVHHVLFVVSGPEVAHMHLETRVDTRHVPHGRRRRVGDAGLAVVRRRIVAIVHPTQHAAHLCGSADRRGHVQLEAKDRGVSARAFLGPQRACIWAHTCWYGAPRHCQGGRATPRVPASYQLRGPRLERDAHLDARRPLIGDLDTELVLLVTRRPKVARLEWIDEDTARLHSRWHGGKYCYQKTAAHGAPSHDSPTGIAHGVALAGASSGSSQGTPTP